MARYGCRKCRKEVKPKDGKLTCCGITESVPVDPKNKPGHCRICGGRPPGDAVHEFLGKKICYCEFDDDGDIIEEPHF